MGGRDVAVGIQQESGCGDRRLKGTRDIDVAPTELAATTRISTTISKDLKKRGFSFVGSTIVYAHMQATGMVNDHVVSCFRHEACKRLM